MNLTKSKILLGKQTLLPLKRLFSSALYITGDNATNTYSVLTPHLDIEERLLDRDALELNLKHRGCNQQVKSIVEMYEVFKQIESHVTVADVTRSEINKRLNELLKSPEKNEEAIARLKVPALVAKKEFKLVKEQVQDVEEAIALKILDLPNVMHHRTPIENHQEFYSYLAKPEGKTESNLQIAKRLDLLEYRDPTFVVLKKDAALFELAVVNYFQKQLLDLNFTQFSNCDFARSIVVEGCGEIYQSKFITFTLDYIHDNARNPITRDHIVGGASLYAFMAYFAKNNIQQGYIPVQLFASGRFYQPTDQSENNLFNVTQSTGVQLFLALEDSEEKEEKTLDDLIETVKRFYEPFGVHFRLVLLQCCSLDKSESLRVSIQMYSPNKSMYIEVGNISLYDKYLSKRLLFTYKQNKERQFFRVISGKLLNVHRLLGCLIENNAVNGNGFMPAMLKHFESM